MSTQDSTGSVSNVRRFLRMPPLFFDLTLADESVLGFFSRRDRGLDDGETVTVRWDAATPLQAGRREALEIFREGQPV